MYLHLGRDVVVPDDTVVAVFDMDNSSASRHTRDFLSRAERDGRVVNVADDIPRSFVVCRDENRTVYLSQLSSATLTKRGDSPFAKL